MDHPEKDCVRPHALLLVYGLCRKLRSCLRIYALWWVNEYREWEDYDHYERDEIVLGLQLAKAGVPGYALTPEEDRREKRKMCHLTLDICQSSAKARAFQVLADTGSMKDFFTDVETRRAKRLKAEDGLVERAVTESSDNESEEEEDSVHFDDEDDLWGVEPV